MDCGACATACPVDAIKPHTTLAEAELPFVELNRLYYAGEPHADRTPMALVPPRRSQPREGVRVAVVGAGPAGMYAADELLRHPGVTVDVYDRLPTPYGLARGGVAPDHQRTRRITELFGAIERQPGFRYRLNVEVGRDIGHAELRRAYHGVFYTVGASGDRRIGIAGEQLPGSVSATAFVGWYNGHPDHRDLDPALDGDRVVVVGNGNVALDVARILTADPARLERTDIADLALARLRRSRVREVVVLGRRGPAEASFTVPELIGLAGLDGVDVVVDAGDEPITGEKPALRLLRELAARPPAGRPRRIVLRFRTAPLEIVGDDSVVGVRVARTQAVGDGVPVATGDEELLACGLVLRAVGYRGRPVPGLPFDQSTGTVPSERGRVRPGTYVAGWIKRGPRGYLGTNKSCAEESVSAFLDDLDAGVLPEPDVSVAELDRTVAGHTRPLGLALTRSPRRVRLTSGRG